MTTSDRRYPFMSRKQVKERILRDGSFARECALVLQQRTDERDAGRAPEGRSWGWMSSQRATAGKMVIRLRARTLSAADESKLAKIVAGYGRQLADHFRTQELRRRPELAEVARVFGLGVPGAPAPDAPGGKRPKPDGASEARGSEAEEQPDAGRGGVGAEDRQAEDDAASLVASALAEAPGLRSEEIAARVGIATAYLGATLREMVKHGRLRKSGAGRGTRYFAL